jgi:hypothetical protein
LGFLYCTLKKSYSVDGHKKPATVAYRAAFISCYFKYERRIPTSKAFDLQEKGEIVINTGFSVVGSLGNQMVEVYVDGFKQMDGANGLGGNLSMRFLSHVKPLIIIGHDECIFKQYCLLKNIGCQHAECRY